MKDLDVAAGGAGPAGPGRDAGTPPPPDRRSGPGLRPALVVLAVAVVIVALFGVGAVLTGGTGSKGHRPSHPTGGPSKVPGTSLRAEPAGRGLSPVVEPGTPPTDIVDALDLPAGSHRLSAHPSRATTLYNAKVRFSVGANQASVITFFRADLARRHWHVISVGAARGHPGATQVLAQKAGSDGWYWEVGATVAPTEFASSSSGGAETTPFTLALFQVNDVA
ncbi:MAG: hypothetical protein ACRDY3_01155 [Acidimicrobiales bacterium]